MFCIAQTHNGQRICMNGMITNLYSRCTNITQVFPQLQYNCPLTFYIPLIIDIIYFFNTQKLFWGIVHFKVLYYYV